MNTNNYLPFDIETALKHPERVVTRDGSKVTELHQFKTCNSYPIVAIVEGDLKTFKENGIWNSEHNTMSDLFLLPEVKECWVNVYEFKNTDYIYTIQLSTELIAKVHSKDDETLKYIKTIRITNEPE